MVIFVYLSNYVSIIKKKKKRRKKCKLIKKASAKVLEYNALQFVNRISLSFSNYNGNKVLFFFVISNGIGVIIYSENIVIMISA